MRDQLFVWPNPASDRLTYVLYGYETAMPTIILRDIQGRILLKENNRENEIDISFLSPGAYIIEAMHEEARSVKILLKR